LFPIATKLRERTESRKTPHGHTPSKRFELRPARSSVGQPTSVQRGQHGPDSSYAPLARLLDGHGGAQRLDSEAFERWRPDDGPLWVELHTDDEADRNWLDIAMGVEPERRELLLQERAWSRVRVPGPDELVL